MMTMLQSNIIQLNDESPNGELFIELLTKY